MVGHIGPGLGFFAIGLWHLINHINFYFQNTTTYVSLPWFPSSFTRYLELYLIMAGSCGSIAMELFIGPANHQPFDPSDWSIPSYHLHNFEHASISLTFLLYAVFALLLDKYQFQATTAKSPNPKPNTSMALLLAAAAFSQQLLMFHLHSTDHMGVEGQYHWLLQLIIGVSLVTTILGIEYRRSFVVGFARSSSIMFQGVWLFVMGIMLWTPKFIPKGCFMNMEEGHLVVRCHEEEDLHRAKSLVNIEFSWYLAGFLVLVMAIYLFLSRKHSYASLELEYTPLQNPSDLESQRYKVGESQSFVVTGQETKGVVDLER